ncbi:hypothetical protein AVDCRST_MAG94-6681 [uncultured Leptolyngbya sp.]|uniref:Uncharacterized protein n=1 Tax=uncultured Leptolyngbya sp. TaxID=332963 RepID=A0A6J4PNU0_9CYAN|nr:hypothetical protein AVDCRST_MAG94-6681 [uncultured Leptolyngbya sp.]
MRELEPLLISESSICSSIAILQPVLALKSSPSAFETLTLDDRFTSHCSTGILKLRGAVLFGQEVSATLGARMVTKLHIAADKPDILRRHKLAALPRMEKPSNVARIDCDLYPSLGSNSG